MKKRVLLPILCGILLLTSCNIDVNLFADKPENIEIEIPTARPKNESDTQTAGGTTAPSKPSDSTSKPSGSQGSASLEIPTNRPIPEPDPSKDDFDGRVIQLLTAINDMGIDLQYDPTNAIEAEMFYRNRYIENQYNCSLASYVSTNNNVVEELEIDELSGKKRYDIAYLKQSSHVTLASKGYLANLLTVESLHLEQDWWNQNQVQGWTVYQNLFGAIGDATITDQSFQVILRNDDLFQGAGTSLDWNTMVKNKQWTLEKMHELAALFYDTDVLGICFNENIFGDFLQACGFNIINPENHFQLGFNSSQIQAVAEQLWDTLLSSDVDVDIRAISPTPPITSSAHYASFITGHAAFMTCDPFTNAQALADREFNIGYLPLPLLSSEQDAYRSLCRAGCLSIPLHAYSIEQSGMVMETMAQHSHSNLKEAFTVNTFFRFLADDAQDDQMLHYLLTTKVFDLGYGADTQNKVTEMIRDVTYRASVPTAASEYMNTNTSYFNQLVGRVFDILGAKG